MEEPTKEQIKKFWEYFDDWIEYPSIDLNNIFKYIVPKLKKEGDILEAENSEPALALFWAIYRIIENDD